MSVPTRSRWLPLLGAIASFLVLAMVAALFVGASRAGESKRSGTTTWSGSSSGKGKRSDIQRSTSKDQSFSTTTYDDDEDGPREVDAWTFSRDHGHWRNNSGSERDWDEVQDLLDRADGDLFWFRRGSDRYVVTDQATLERLAELFAPQEELGRKQGELGGRQGVLGAQQGELGRKQAELGQIQAKLGRIQARLSSEQASRGRRDIETASLDRQIDEVSQQQSEVGELQSELGERQATLGERQAALGEQQAELGRQQAEISKKIARQLDTLTREWIESGVAKPAER